MKQSCFAMGGNGECKILIKTSCDQCRFFKTQKDFYYTSNRSIEILKSKKIFDRFYQKYKIRAIMQR